MKPVDDLMDYERWAERYDIFYEAAPEGELDFYLNAIDRVSGSVLELGVGTGRIAIPAAVMGHHVTGVDMSRPMLNRARRKLDHAPLTGSLELVEADISELDLPKRDFDLVIIPAHTLALVTDAQRQFEVIKRCRMHMAPDAALIFNLFNPSDDLINDEPGERFLLGVVEDEENDVRHILSGVNNFDVANQINHCVQTIETFGRDGDLLDSEDLPVVFRYLHHEQVLDLISRAGLRADEVYGDFDGSPLSQDSEEMIYICRLA